MLTNQKRVEMYHQVIHIFRYCDSEEIMSLRESFVSLSANPGQASQRVTVSDLCKLYLTQDSIVNNFKDVFGYQNENLALRFYNILAEGFNGVHIYLPTFYVKL